eukprot:TRINITY_DN10592_c0_g1_i7.p1 TRINITY_DN10592_c0_g1~~TRINITY_DN10592_c0_g1_i7.p1  ORF type:complete len:227 (-),score=32.51 TRINITY_DN10592_c0_g1_i7:66-746(-)
MHFYWYRRHRCQTVPPHLPAQGQLYDLTVATEAFLPCVLTVGTTWTLQFNGGPHLLLRVIAQAPDAPDVPAVPLPDLPAEGHDDSESDEGGHGDEVPEPEHELLPGHATALADLVGYASSDGEGEDEDGDEDGPGPSGPAASTHMHVTPSIAKEKLTGLPLGRIKQQRHGAWFAWQFTWKKLSGATTSKLFSWSLANASKASYVGATEAEAIDAGIAWLGACLADD